MRSKFILVTFLISCSATLVLLAPHSLAQSGGNLNVVDVNGLRQGYWKINAQMLGAVEFNNPGKVIKEGYYKDSKPTGVWTEQHIDGTVTEWLYDDTSSRAIAQRFYQDANHNMLYETRYKGNLHDGPAKIYYPNGGKLAVELTWSNGRIDGPMKTYYPNGKVCEEGWWIESYWAYSGYTLYNEQGKVIKEIPVAVFVGPEGYDKNVINGQ